MKFIKRHSVKIYLALAVAGLVTLYLWPTLVAAMPLTARHDLARAWQLAADVGRYDYQTSVVQTNHPTLTLGNVGRTAQSEHFMIEGELDRPDDLLTMSIAMADQAPLEVKLEQGLTYGRMSGVEGMEEWTEIEIGSDLFAPGGDPLGFLSVVENVQQIDQNSNLVSTDEYFPADLIPVSLADTMTRYQFDVSGPKYAQHMRGSLEQALRERGELPMGMSLQTPHQYVDLTGHGEIWISDSGLPMRQIIRLEFPPEPGADVWVEAEITTNFNNWQEPGPTYALLQAIPRVIDDPSILASNPLSLLPNLHTPLARLQPEDLQAFGILLGLSLLLAALALLAITHRRSPKFYAAISVSMIALMLVTPLLQSQQVHAATTRFYARQAEAVQHQAETAAQTEEDAAPTFNPNQSPLENVNPPFNSLPQEEETIASPPFEGTKDGQLIPQLQGSCVITASSDCDGDGLTDNVEIYELGTRIDKIDTDDDGISDKTEVTGFSLGGQSWYLDPRSADSNGDGLDDGSECFGRVDVITTTLLTPLFDDCDDADGDGVPNVHDFDDDGDGVPDGSDLAHLNVQTVTNQIFNLEITGATADTNLLVDFQIRPTDDRHLWWTNSVLNWPDGDTSGQIQRTTPDTLAPDGDIELIPMLEIVIPYSAANPAGALPIANGVSIGTIDHTTPISTWLDTNVINEYAISIVSTESGDRVVYVPLIVATDPNGGSPVAWHARMPYKLAAGISDWGAAHQVKLTWIVSGQNDASASQQGLPQILQSYYDDFIVTGLQVQEHHGAEAMMVAQSNNTGHYEPELWHLADTLQHAYFDSQTVNNQRFTLADIPTTYTSWGMGSNSLTFNHITGLADDVALLNAVTGDAVPAFLRDNVYTSPADGTVANVMLLSEETRRLRTMGDVDFIENGNDLVSIEYFTFANNTFTVDMNSTSLETNGAMRLQPYQYTAGLGWDTVDIDPFLQDLITDLEGVFTTPVMTTLLAGDPVIDVDRAQDGAVLLAVHYYLGLYLPTALPVAIEGQPLNGALLVNVDHQRPAEPAAAIVQRLATNLKTFFGLLNLNDLDIPTVENEKAASAAAAWAQLAASKGAILEGFGDVLQGNTASSAALALLEIQNYPETINTANLLDSGVYYIINNIISDYVSGTVNPYIFGTSVPTEGDNEQCRVVECTGRIVGAIYSVSKRTYLLLKTQRKIIKTIDKLKGKISDDRLRLLSKNLSPSRRGGLERSIASNQALIAKAITTKVKVMAVSGVVFAAGTGAVTIGIALASGQVQADSPAFSRLLAEQIASVAVESFLAILYLAALTTTTFALSIALAFLAVIDTVIIAVCEAFNNKSKFVEKWVCNGITAAIAKLYSYVLNDTTPLVELEHDERLTVLLDSPVLNNDSGLDGVIVGNSITFSGNVTTTLYMDDPNWMGYVYAWQWTDDSLDDAAFRYKLQTSEQDVSVALESIAWQDVPDKKDYSVSANDARFRNQLPIEAITYNLTVPGIDQGLPIYFSEGFTVRQQNCWLLGVVIKCSLSQFDNTSHSLLTDSFIFDVLPGTIDEFRVLASQTNEAGDNGYRLAWDTKFPILADADGDGLRSQAMGGVDPNDSTPDSDGDGLNDYFELNTKGYNAEQADSDCDGLIDYYELFYRTAPDRADSDGDGLLDGQEMFHPNRLNPYENSWYTNANAPACADNNADYSGGWPIVYDYDSNNDPLITWVNADPNDFDSDDDTLTDQQERTYAYNPNVASTLNVLRLDSQIETDSGVMPFISPTGTISYTTQITNELRLPYALGLLETELPLDNVLRYQSTGVIAPQSAVTVNGSVGAAEAGLNSSGPVDMGLRAGASLDDPTGRVLWLHMNEPTNSTTFVDASYLQHDGTCSGDNCPTGNGDSLVFDGDDAIVVPDSDDLDMSQYTIALAVKPTTSLTYNRTLMAKTSNIGFEQNYQLNLTSANEVHFITYNGCGVNGYNFINTPALPLNEWSHITASYDGSTKKIYLNGTLVDSTAYSGTPCQTDYPVYIGARYGESGPHIGFIGELDEVEIFPTVLDEATILANYATPVLQLDMRDGITWGSDAASCSGAACPAAGGNGASFGQVDHLTVTAPDLSGDAFAFATWIKPQARPAPLDSTVGGVYGKDTDRDWQGVFGNMVYNGSQPTWPYATTIYPSLFVSSDGALRMTMANNSPACEITTKANNLIQSGVWQHLVVSYDGSNFTFYVNGKPVAGGVDGPSCAGVVPPTLSDFYIGRPNDYGYAWVDRVNVTRIDDSESVADIRTAQIRLNRNNDGTNGNVWEKSISSTGVQNIEHHFFVQDTPQWIRLYENDRKESTAFESASTFTKDADDNWKHLTNIKNNTYLGLQGYNFEGPDQTPTSNNEDRSLGTLYFGVFNDYFQGELDDFRVYNYAINDGVVTDLYNGTSVALDLRFDEAPGADLFADESGNYVTVSCSGDTCPTSGIPGRFNQALEFDGTDDYLTIGTSSTELGTSKSNFSVMMWIKPDTFWNSQGGGLMPLIEVGKDRVDNEYNLGLLFGALYGDGDLGVRYTDFSLYNVAKRWYHLAYVFNNGTYTFYVNGENVGTAYISRPNFASSLRIGGDTKGNYFDGLLDDLTVVKRAVTQAEVQAHFERVPVVNLHLDEDLSLTSFADDTENRYTATCSGSACPKPGDKGQMREAIIFDGADDHLTLADTADLALTDFSAGLWVKPTKTVNAPQYLMTKADSSFFNANFRLWLLDNTLTVRFDRQSSCAGSDSNWHTVDATNPLLEDQWNHVFASHDSVNGEMKLYINGALAGTTTATGNSVCTATNPIQLGQSFNGVLDEVNVMPSVLEAEAVAELYNYQAAWFDVINHHPLYVDADAPTVDLTLIPAIVSAAETVMYVGAEDASSAAAKVEYRIDGGAWQEATPNGGNAANSSAWLFAFEEAAGSYTIEAQATDLVGNVSTIASAAVLVDDQTPTLTLDTPSGPVQALSNYIFSGTVNDTESGLPNNAVILSTVDRTGQPVSGNQPATIEGNNWLASQPFLDIPYGRYTATVSAVDQVGNQTSTSSQFQLDGLPPYADVTDDENYINPTTIKTITGIASDVPHRTGGRTLHLHFEPGTGLWVDGTDTGFTMACAAGADTCPTTGVAGQRGQAITFDGVDDGLVFTRNEAITTSTTVEQLGLSGGSFTVMAWVKGDNWSGDQAILGSSPATATDDFFLGLQNGQPILSHDSDSSVMSNSIPTSEWVHVAWRFSETSGERAFFVNGTLGFTSTGHSIFGGTDAIQVGQMQGSNAFAGSLDELVIYGQPLSDETIYDIANPLDVGVTELELRIRSYEEEEFDIGQFEGTWTPINLDNNGQLFSTWDYTLPSLPLGGYKIDLRVTDEVGNSSFVEGAWDLAVVAPDVQISKQSDVTLAANGDTISYTISYTNTSPALATSVVITEIIPIDTTFAPTLSDPAWACLPDGSAGSSCTLAVGDLEAGASDTISFTVMVNNDWSAGTTSIANTVLIGTDGADGNQSDNRDTHQIPINAGVDLAVSIADDGTAIPYDASGAGEAPPMIYTISYTNAGTQPAQPGLTVEWSGAGTVDYSVGASSWDCDSTVINSFGVNGICTQALDQLDIGQSGVVTFALEASYFISTDLFVNTLVTIEDLAGATEVITANNQATEVTPLNIEYDLVSDSDSLTIQEGQVITTSGELIVPADTNPLDIYFGLYPTPGEVTGPDFRTAEDLTWVWSYTTTDGPEQSQPVTWIAEVGEGGLFLNKVISLTVENVPPTVAITGADTVPNGVLYNLTLGEVIDPGDDTVTACTLDWGDGNSEDCFASLGGGTLSHTYGLEYSEPLITVNLTDEDGTHVAASKSLTVSGLSYSLDVDESSVMAYESQTAMNSGTYGPADASLIWLASEGTVTQTNGIWYWSLPPGSAEGTREVTITADSQTISFDVTVQGDGVASDIEAGAPNSGDGNNDGVLDQAQMHVASLPSPVTNEYVTVVASSGMTLTNVSLTAAPAEGDGDQPAGIAFPLGYLDFDLAGMGVGGNANVTLLISGTHNINSYGQYDASNDWYTFLYDNATDTGAEIISDERIILYLVDGERGDGDGAANGTIANLGGPANQQQPKNLTINISGNGVVSPSAGDYTQGTELTMVATPDPGWRFSGWSGALSGSAPSQNLTMDQDKSVTAIFVQESYTLVDHVVGGGSITIDPDQSSYLYGDGVAVEAIAETGWQFAGWSGDLSGDTISESLSIDGNKVITATFTPEAYTVDVEITGNGDVTLSPQQSSYAYGDEVLVEALPDPGYTLDSWSGDLSDNALVEILTIDGNKSISALFATDTYSVETSVLGNGNIVVEPDQASYNYGDLVTVTAVPDPGWTLSGWGLDLSGMTATQSFTITGNATLLAEFEAESYTLASSWIGEGGITVNPDTPTYTYGQEVTLTASPDLGWYFLGWSGASSDTTLTTTLTMTSNQSIIATFDPFSYTLSVSKTGTGSGQVTTALPAIDCGDDCGELLPYGTVISLTATPDADSIFTGWSGDLGESDANPLTVTVTEETVVTANFVIENVNEPPVLTTIGDQSVNEGETVNFTAVATDSGVPTQTLTYSLSNAPSGAIIGDTSGLFSWITDESDGPGVYTATVIVSDGSLTDSQIVEITVNEVNEAPVLTLINDQSVLEGETVTFTAAATDSDVPTQTLTYSLSNAPTGATIDPVSGLFSWPTDADDGPDVYTATVIVSDGDLTDTQIVNITVTEAPVAPVLALIGPQNIDETEILTFTAVATDGNDDTLTYSLSGAPAGATIGETTGLFEWATTEADGPGVYSATVVVSDGSLTDEQVVEITVDEVNVTPVLDPISDQAVTEGETVSFTATANDSDVPEQTLSYSLSNAPAEASINSNGAFSWVTDENDGPGVYNATVIVSDGTLTDSQTIQITVNEETTAPVLDPIAPQTIAEMQTLTFTATAVDPDNDALTYGLYNASSGMSIDSSTGEFSWTPTEAQGPAAYFFSVMVTDTTGLTDTTVAMVNVTEVNQAPVLDPIAAQTLPKTQPFSLTVVATDGDYPANGLSYTMINAPDGAALDESSGLFRWTPEDTQGPAEYTITFVVTDNGTPVLSDTQDVTFTVTNNPGVLITESDGSTDVAFGGYDTYEMVLIAQPTDTVTVTMSTDGQVETIPTRLVFTPDNWDEPQMVSTNAMDDVVYEGPHTGLISHSASSDDPGYDGIGIVNVTVNIADDTEDLPVITIGDVTVDENVGTATVPVTLTGESVFPTEVSFEVSDGTALGSGVDYDATNGTLTWAANISGTQTISLTIVDDTDEEPAETINVALTNVVSGTIEDSNAVVTINANDEPVPEPLLSITKAVTTLNNPVKPGDTITYTIVVLNSGQGVAEQVTVQDTLPTYFSGTDLDQTVTVSVNQAITFTVTGTVDSKVPVGLTTITNTASFSHSLSDGQASATIVVSKTVEPEPSDLLYLSARRNGSVDGLSYADEDILVYDPDADTWAKLFDGSDVGYRGADIDAFTILEDGSLLLSADRNRNLDGLGRVDDSDIVRFIPTSLGENTVGTFEWYFDASDVRLTRGGEDVDAISVTSEGKLLISTIGSFRVAGIGGRDEDLILFTPTSLGENTNGTWERYFDGSDVGLRSWREDVRGGQIDEATGDIYLTTDRRFEVPGLEGEGTDIFICTPTSLGVNTECEFSLYWAGEEYGFDRDIDAFAIGGEVAVEVTATTIALADIEEPDSPEEEDRAEDDEDNEDDTDEVHDLDDTSLGIEAGTTTLFLPIVAKQ